MNEVHLFVLHVYDNHEKVVYSKATIRDLRWCTLTTKNSHYSIKGGIQVAFNCEDALLGRPVMFTQMCASIATGTISRKLETGMESKITSAVKTIVKQQMQLDDETLYVHVKSFKRYSKIQSI